MPAALAQGQAGVPQAATKLAAIQARRKTLAEVDVLHGEVAALAKRCASVDDAGFKPLVDDAAAREKKLQDYGAANKIDRDTRRKERAQTLTAAKARFTAPT